MSEDPTAEFPVFAPDETKAVLDSERAKLLAQQGRDGAASSQESIDYDSQDPSYITAMEHFEGFSHKEIFDHVQAMNIRAITELGKSWRDIAAGLSAKVVGSRLALNRALSEGFGGEFAATAAEAAESFFDGANNLQHAVSAVGYRIGSVAGGAEAVRLSVPPPPVRSVSTDGMSEEAQQVTEAIVGAAAPASDADFTRQQEEQRQVAIGVMNTVYKPTYQPAGDGVPTFVPVTAPGDDSTGPGPSGNTTTNGSGAPGPGSTTANPPSEEPSGDRSTDPNGEDSQSTTAASTEQPTTTPAGTAPGDPQRSTPAGTTTAPATPGAPGQPSTPGSPGPPGTPQAPTPGHTVPGAPGSPAPGTSTTAAASRAGRPMSTGVPGMVSPGGARKGEDEQEHRTPDYLIIDRREELFGEERPTVPGAIGADAEAAQPTREDGRR